MSKLGYSFVSKNDLMIKEIYVSFYTTDGKKYTFLLLNWSKKYQIIFVSRISQIMPNQTALFYIDKDKGKVKLLLKFYHMMK